MLLSKTKLKTKLRGPRSRVKYTDRLCSLVVRVTGYRSRDSGFDSLRYRVFWEVVGLEQVHSASSVKLRGCLEEIVAAPV
jgi:hypothetical protein